MNKLLFLGALCCGIVMSQYSFSDDSMSADSSNSAPTYNQGYRSSGFNGGSSCCAPAPVCPPACDQQAAPADAPCDSPVNDCWCRYVHYKPCYYTTKRCIEEQIPYKKKCYRYVPKYYEVQRCKMVPQYYTETCCRQECECYYVDECRPCKRWVCDQHCEYKPCYYWKHICGDANCTTPCPR